MGGTVKPICQFQLGIRQILLAALVFLAGCLDNKENIAGRGSEAENEIHGVLVDASGDVVQGARVIAYSKDTSAFSPSLPLDSGRTDNRGIYSLKSLQSGTYNLVGESKQGPLLVLISNIDHIKNQRLNLGVDTMKSPGGIVGRVIQGRSGKQGVMVYMPGTSFLALTDELGNYKFTDIPEGIYLLKYQSFGKALATQSDIKVIAGETLKLPDQYLPIDTTEPPPAPTGGIGTLDTLTSQVKLQWDPVQLGDLLGYRVYRDKGSLSLPEAISGLVTDTFFTDINPLFQSGEIPEATYRIRTVDKQLNEGIEFTAEIKVKWVSPDIVTTEMRMRQLTPPYFHWLIGEPLPIEFEYSNPIRLIKTLTWYVNDSAVKTVEVGNSRGSDTLLATWFNTGLQGAYVTALDNAGKIWRYDYLLDIHTGAPYVNAGNDTLLSLGDELTLSPQVTDLFSEVIRWEWDIGGTGKFSEFPQGKASITLPRIENKAYPCIFRATNEKGRIGIDTVLISIVADKPVARIKFHPLEGIIGDTLVFTAQGSFDKFGSIKKHIWKVDPPFNLDVVNDSMVRLTSSRPDTMPCKLIVVDDDDQKDSIQVEVRFKDSKRWALWSKDSAMQDFNRFLTWADEDSVWIIGPSIDSLNLFNSHHVWSSADMVHWNRSKVDGLYDIIEPMQCIRHNGKLWVFDWDGLSLLLKQSIDGRDWDLVDSSNHPTNLTYTRLAVHNNKLWVFGISSSSMIRKFEIWSSSNGSNWERVTENPAFGLLEPLATYSWQGRLWLYGLHNLDPNSEVGIYSSQDGLNWNMESSGIFNGFRQSVQFLVKKEELWLATTQDAPMTFWGELMRSIEGKTWRPHSLEAPTFSDYGYVRMLVFKERFWILSSSEDSDRRRKWEIWRSPKDE